MSDVDLTTESQLVDDFQGARIRQDSTGFDRMTIPTKQSMVFIMIGLIRIYNFMVVIQPPYPIDELLIIYVNDNP